MGWRWQAASHFPPPIFPASPYTMTNPATSSRSLLLFALFYGGMVTLAGVLGAKQVSMGPLAVEAGIFPFLTLIGISSGIAELHGKETADRLIRYGFAPLVGAIVLTLFVLQLPLKFS